MAVLVPALVYARLVVHDTICAMPICRVQDVHAGVCVLECACACASECSHVCILLCLCLWLCSCALDCKDSPHNFLDDGASYPTFYLTVTRGLGNGSHDGAGERGVIGLLDACTDSLREEMDSKQQCVMLLSIAHGSFAVALGCLGVDAESFDERGGWEGW